MRASVSSHLLSLHQIISPHPSGLDDPKILHYALLLPSCTLTAFWAPPRTTTTFT